MRLKGDISIDGLNNCFPSTTYYLCLDRPEQLEIFYMALVRFLDLRRAHHGPDLQSRGKPLRLHAIVTLEPDGFSR